MPAAASRPRLGLRRLFAPVFVAFAALLVVPVFAPEAHAQEEPTVGVYVTSLRDFEPASDSFGVDFWVWSTHPRGEDPLGDMEFVNAKQVDVRLEQTARRGGGSWSRRKVRTTVLHEWDLSNYPFDRQVLRMDLRIADDGGDSGAYRPDLRGSGHDAGIAPDGWRLTGFGVREREVSRETAFGDPEAGGRSSQEHVFVTLEVQREDLTGFLKLVAGVYVAVAIALLSFLMKPDEATVFSGRMTVLVGSLFATVVNMQVSSATLGAAESVSLVDKIHILAMALIFASALMAMVSRGGYEAGRKDLARRRDRLSLLLFATTFVLMNAALIGWAAIAG